MGRSPEKFTLNQNKIEIPYEHLLTEKQKTQLHDNINVVKFRKKDVIFRQNTRTSHLMFINSGYVKIFKEGRSDRTVILKIATAGEYIGLMSVFGEKLHQYSASSISDSEICDLDIMVVKSILMENGRFALHFLKLLSMDGLFVFNRLLSQSHKQLPGRIADLILYFAEDVYKSQSFTFPLTRKELAELAGTTKESLIRTLTEFKNDKIIDIQGSGINIRSMDIIRTLSELG